MPRPHRAALILTLSTLACTPAGRQGTQILIPVAPPADAGVTAGRDATNLGWDALGADAATGPRPDGAAPLPDSGVMKDEAGVPIDGGSPLTDGGVVTPSGDAGTPTGPPPAEPLGPAPQGNFTTLTTIVIANDRAQARVGETAFSSIPVAQQLNLRDTANLAIIGPGNLWLAGQFDPVSRWAGVVDDTSRPIRWLQVSVQADVPANSSVTYEIRKYDNLSPANDTIAASVSSSGDTHTVSTGVATWVINASNPAFFDRIDLGGTTVYQHEPGAGPRLTLGGRTFSSANAGQLQVDTFELVERGPVKVVAAMVGHFVGQGTTCASRGYQAQAFTIVATFHRGRSYADLELHYANECSDAFNPPWTDETVRVSDASWHFPLAPAVAGNPTTYYGGSGAVQAANGAVVVEQQRGGGSPWRRRARVTVAGQVADNAETFAAPFAAVSGSGASVAVTMPWMRFREPQALGADGRTVSMHLVSEQLTVGEGKAIWGFGRLAFGPPGDARSLGPVRDLGVAALERGLLVRAPNSYFNSTKVLPSLGNSSSSNFKTTYRQTLEGLHADTIGPQWRDAKTYGSQLWPDVQFDQWGTTNNNPGQNSARLNYWDPAGAELLEFVRSGEPRWVWDFALPQSWLQMHTAYMNLGDHFHGNRNGFAVTSGGEGEGQWHRSAQGSDDYTYDMGQFLAYALRPTFTHRRRFAQAGRNFMNRYSVARANQGSREQFVSEVHISRQFIQHFELLASCAAYVPGQVGRDCHQKLIATLTELAEENMPGGLICEGDAPTGNRCSIDQQFMMNALHLPFFHRLYRNYGDVGGNLKNALVGSGLYLYAYGLAKSGGLGGLQNGMGLEALMALQSRPDLVPNGEWAARMECNMNGDTVQNCVNADADMFDHNRPHTVAILLMAHEVDPRARLCGVAKRAANANRTLVGWDFAIGGVGWTKGSGQMMQATAYGVGVHDTCSD